MFHPLENFNKTTFANNPANKPVYPVRGQGVIGGKWFRRTVLPQENAEMEIEIVGVADIGDLERERLVLKVAKSCDIGYFLVLDGTCLENGAVSTRVRQPYWFPDRKVKIGDRILLYTKKGAGPKERKEDDGTTTYCFYRQLESTAWDRGGDSAIVLGVSSWVSKKYGKAENQSEASAVF